MMHGLQRTWQGIRTLTGATKSAARAGELVAETEGGCALCITAPSNCIGLERQVLPVQRVLLTPIGQRQLSTPALGEAKVRSAPEHRHAIVRSLTTMAPGNRRFLHRRKNFIATR